MPMYEYEVLDADGEPTGERFEVFQHMREDALDRTGDGRPCRRAFAGNLHVRVEPSLKLGGNHRLRGVHRVASGGSGVYNPRLSNPHVSMTLPYDPRDGVIGLEDGVKVRRHQDGTLTTYDPENSTNDRRPIVRHEDDRKKFCDLFNATHIKE